jgi:CheY-like chemotaxis protein
MNLCINARDAMPNGGTIQMATANVTALQGGPLPGLPAGEYVRFSIADSGQGIPPEVLPHIFEPFFTTKPAGIGTGLGLATCRKIIEQSGGRITVQSSPGRGTIFTIYLPRAEGGAPLHHAAANEGPLPRGDESILLVEDEPGLLDLAATILSKQGYEVLRAANGQEALKLAHERGEHPVDLVLTDMVMPLMGGVQLNEKLRELWPEVRVLFTSGYSDCDLTAEAEAGTVEFLPKPYAPSLLIRKVREVLDKEEAAPCWAPALEASTVSIA